MTLEPSKKRWEKLKREAPPETWRRVRWCYFLLSVALLWWQLAYIESHDPIHWLQHAALSVVYFAVLLLLAAWLIPREAFRRLGRVARILKLSFVFNYLSLLILLQLFIGAWWARTLILAALFLVSYLGVFIFHSFLLPAASVTQEVFLGGEKPFDPTATQGRRAKFD